MHQILLPREGDHCVERSADQSVVYVTPSYKLVANHEFPSLGSAFTNPLCFVSTCLFKVSLISHL